MVPPSSQDEALSRYSVSGEVPREELEVEMVLGTLDKRTLAPYVHSVLALLSQVTVT